MTPQECQQREQQIPDQIRLKTEWGRKFVLGYGIHYGLGVITIALSLLVGAQPHLLVRGLPDLATQADVWKFVAWLSAAATAVFAVPQSANASRSISGSMEYSQQSNYAIPK